MPSSRTPDILRAIEAAHVMMVVTTREGEVMYATDAIRVALGDEKGVQSRDLFDLLRQDRAESPLGVVWEEGFSESGVSFVDIRIADLEMTCHITRDDDLITLMCHPRTPTSPDLELYPDGSIRRVSSRMERIIGASSRSLNGRPLLNFVHKEDHRSLIESLDVLSGQSARRMHSAQSRSVEWRARFLHESGAWCEVESHIWLEVLDGEIVRVALRSHEVSQSISKTSIIEGENEQHDLRAKEKKGATPRKSEPDGATPHDHVLLQLFDHDLRTPINNIRGYAELMLEEAEGKASKDLSQIHHAARTLQRLLDNLVELERINRSDIDLGLEAIAPDTLIDDLKDYAELLLLRHEAKVTFRHELDDNETIYSDRVRLVEGLTQLVAFFAPRASFMLVALRAPDERHTQSPHLNIEIEVIGFEGDRDMVHRVLSSPRLATLMSHRDLLDIYVCARRFELLGGDLEVRGDETERFILRGTLPLPQHNGGPPTPSLLTQGEERETIQGRRILVIDDDHEVHHIIQTWSREKPYELHGAFDALDGMKKIRDLSPDLIVLDVVMPTLDGWSVLTQLRRNPLYEMTPVIVVSIVTDEDLAHSLGATAHLKKPLNRDLFLDTIDRLLVEVSSS